MKIQGFRKNIVDTETIEVFILKREIVNQIKIARPDIFTDQVKIGSVIIKAEQEGIEVYIQIKSESKYIQAL